MAKSSLCATPFLISNVAVSSLKSVFLRLSPSTESLLLNTLTLLFKSRMLPAISTPFSAPSAKFKLAFPNKAFLSAPTEPPCVVTSMFTVPRPSSISFLIASTINGPTFTFFMLCLNAMLGVLRASTFSVPSILPPYKFAAKGDSVAMPLPAFRPTCTFSVLTLANFNQPILASPEALSVLSAVKSSGVSPLLFAAESLLVT